MEERIQGLTDRVRECAFGLHSYLRYGHLEKVYENGLFHRLKKAGVAVAQQVPLKVYDEDDTILGDYFADLLVEGQLIVELKACRALVPDHTAQVLGYLRASRLQHGVLINFGAPKLEIKKFIL